MINLIWLVFDTENRLYYIITIYTYKYKVFLIPILAAILFRFLWELCLTIGLIRSLLENYSERYKDFNCRYKTL